MTLIREADHGTPASAAEAGGSEIDGSRGLLAQRCPASVWGETLTIGCL